MRKIWLLLILFTTFQARAEVPPPDCHVENLEWEQLVHDFVEGWQGRSEFCEFKRFVAMNTMLSLDMRTNADRYERRLRQLESYGDQSEAVNYLLSAFQETWFNLFIDASLDREFSRASSMRKSAFGATLAVLGLSLVLPHMKSYSSRTTRFLRAFVSSFFDKRPFVFGTTSLAKAGSRLSLGERADVRTGFVRPPLLKPGEEPSDARTLGVFTGEFHEELLAATVGVGAGWGAGHYASLGVKAWLPKWTTIFTRAKWARNSIADFASPGLLVGAAITYKVSDLAATAALNFQFQKRVRVAKDALTSLARDVGADVRARDEYGVWLHGERLKNGLMLQNYLLTRRFSQALADASERAVRAALSGYADCEVDRKAVDEAVQRRFAKTVGSLLSEEKINLDAALDITQEVQDILLANADALTEPLIDTNQRLLLRDRYILDRDGLVSAAWDDIWAATKEANVACVARPPAGGYFP